MFREPVRPETGSSVVEYALLTSFVLAILIVMAFAIGSLGVGLYRLPVPPTAVAPSTSTVSTQQEVP